jgi:hypothetical protein
MKQKSTTTKEMFVQPAMEYPKTPLIPTFLALALHWLASWCISSFDRQAVYELESRDQK